MMAIIQNTISALMGSTGGKRWQDKLKPSSFRGIPFAVVAEDGGHGRRQAVHEYPYRDTAWVEDMGRGIRRITIRGFLVEDSQVYGGGDVITQRQALINACEEKGPGTLVHPALGEMTVSIPEGGLRIAGTAEAGRVFEFTLTAIESGLKVFAVTSSRADAATVGTNYLKLVTTTVSSVLARLKGEIRGVTQGINTIRGTIAFWTRMVDNTVSEVMSVSNVLNSTFGNTRYGRYNKGTVGGRSSGATGTHRVADTDNYQALVEQVTARAVMDRQNISAAIERLNNASTPGDITQLTADLVNLMLNSVGDIDERIKLFGALADATCNGYQPSESTQKIASSANTLILVLCSGAMTAAAAASDPVSCDVAEDITRRISDQLDVALVVTGDRGDDDIYRALLNLRSSFVDRMSDISPDLSELMEISTARPLPALTLANRLYQDASRAGELVQETDIPHPAFMPLKMKVLRQ
ncbi:DNA circularization protein [Salmonella enterica]